MNIQNRRDSSKFNVCSQHQNRNGLISMELAIAYFAYTQHYALLNKMTATIQLNKKLR